MRRLAWLLLLLAPACSDMPEDYPVAPGGWAPGDNNQRDSGVDDGGDGGAMIAGRVCVLGDLRDLETCAVADAGGLTVSLGTRTATTEEDGAFTIPAPAGSNLVWRVTGPTLITTVMPFGTATKIPAVTDATFGAVLSGSGVVLSLGQGSLVARVVQAGQPVTGAIAVAAPDPQYDPYYDGDSATTWDQDSTGPAGLVWLTGVPVGTSVVMAMRAGGGNVAETHLVEDQAITFATLEIP